MRRTILFITLLLSVVVFSSCKKDGIYNPKEKIDKIYLGYNSQKYLIEDWTWDKKQLKTIDHYGFDCTISSTDYFTYRSDNRLMQVDNPIENLSTKYNYDNRNNLLSASFSESGILTTLYEFEYDDKELSKINVTIYDENWEFHGNAANPLQYILPEKSLNCINKVLRNSLSRGNSTFEIDLDWEGSNLTEVEVKMGKYSEEYIFEYDNKSNPFRNFLGLYFEASLFERGNYASKNNITKITIIESYDEESISDTEFISYTYDGKFPITRSYDDMTEYFEYE